MYSFISTDSSADTLVSYWPTKSPMILSTISWAPFSWCFCSSRSCRSTCASTSCSIWPSSGTSLSSSASSSPESEASPSTLLMLLIILVTSLSSFCTAPSFDMISFSFCRVLPISITFFSRWLSSSKSKMLRVLVTTGFRITLFVDRRLLPLSLSFTFGNSLKLTTFVDCLTLAGLFGTLAHALVCRLPNWHPSRTKPPALDDTATSLGPDISFDIVSRLSWPASPFGLARDSTRASVSTLAGAVPVPAMTPSLRRLCSTFAFNCLNDVRSAPLGTLTIWN